MLPQSQTQLIPTNELVPIAQLRPNPQNPRSIKKDDFERLKRQLAKLKAYKPIVVDTRTGLVLDGHMRLAALKDMGVEEVWVSYIGTANDGEALEYMLSSNDAAGRYDDQLLAELVASTPDIDLGDYKVDLGEPVDLKELLEKFGPEPEVEEDEAPDVSSEPARSELGVVYQLGRHRLMCGDATNPHHIDALLSDATVDMVYTDPPYGMDYSGRGENTSNKILNDNMDPTDFYNIGSEIAERYIWGRVENYKHLLTEPRDVIIWKKNNFGMGRGYRGQYECCFYYGSFSGSDSDVWEVAKDPSYDHPTQKPVALAARAIKNSNPETVVDYFGGSGSTLIACEQTNRTCYTMELDPRYVDVIRRRYWKLVNGTEDGWEEGTPAIEEAHAEAVAA